MRLVAHADAPCEGVVSYLLGCRAGWRGAGAGSCVPATCGAKTKKYALVPSPCVDEFLHAKYNNPP